MPEIKAGVPHGSIMGYQYWPRLTPCKPEYECDAEGGHLHCTRIEGDHVRFTTRDGESGEGIVKLHWHYEGCMVSVQRDDLTKARLCPGMGDRIELIEKKND